MYEVQAETLDARHTGRLEARGPCLVIVDPLDQLHTVVWPSPGTEWNAVTSTISVNGVEAQIGATVTLTGGEGNVSPEELVESDWVTPPLAECVENPLWFADWMLIDPAG
jgi:hypothetical protein